MKLDRIKRSIGEWAFAHPNGLGLLAIVLDVTLWVLTIYLVMTWLAK